MPSQDDRALQYPQAGRRKTLIGAAPHKGKHTPDLRKGQVEMHLGPLARMKQQRVLPHGSGIIPPLSETTSARPGTPASAQYPPGPLTTGQITNAYMTRISTTTLPRVGENNATQTTRVPVTIKASMKRPAPTPPPLPPDLHKEYRWIMTLLGAGLLVIIVLMTLFSVTPLGHEIGFDGTLTLPGSKVITGQNPGVSSIIAQATATAIYHRKTDGYDPSFFGSQLAGTGNSSLAWPFGQCTYWANYEYHRLSGHWISWNGNADQWVTGARQAGWNVSTTPHVPSIMVMMPYTQHSSGYGHVAVVVSASGNIVHTSNMNWWSNGGGWGRVSTVDFS